ncbi:glycosyl transferase [Bacillus salacetis]|uniref:Glycosyl transferase n=1 Tax=Bacillus salacetis TaxID=2315464 RepID=A0A3A1R1W8_9BACI|nr:ATP-grasp fold amidoligase family protein [Bacillus salacetis]RIW36057.1 glycosyl transferase [Bacillus salacetis]
MAKDNVIYNTRRYLQKIALKVTSNEFMSKLYFWIILKEKLDFKNPTSFNEKIQWLKLYDYPNNPLVIQCADKYAVREYIKEKGCSTYLNGLIGVWDKVDDINWNELPEKFVMKCNHGCGYNIICDNKSELDIEEAKTKLTKWMKEDFGLFNAEPHYSKIPRKIICEEHLGDDIVDYKFFSFNGEPKFMYIAKGFGKGHNERITFLDMDGNRAPFKRTDYDEIEGDFDAPQTFSTMVELSRKLSENFTFVRVDFFEIGGKIYFSELTFTPNGGLMPFSPKNYDDYWGNMIDLKGLR